LAVFGCIFSHGFSLESLKLYRSLITFLPCLECTFDTIDLISKLEVGLKDIGDPVTAKTFPSTDIFKLE